MKPKTILMPFGGQDSETGALQTALLLAKKFDAHLEVWHISPDPYVMLALNSGPGIPAPYFDESTVTELKKHFTLNRKETKLKFQNLIKKLGIPLDSPNGKITKAGASFHTDIGNIEEIISIRARLADLIVISRTPKKGFGKFQEVLHNCIFKSGSPVLVIPPGKTPKRINKNILIAWNGSEQATRAVSLAESFLEKSKICIATAWTKDTSHIEIPPEDLAKKLKRHGIDSKVIWVDKKKNSIPEAIIKTAITQEAGLIIMGAYTHSRIREAILGGMTEYMLNNSTIPILMSH